MAKYSYGIQVLVWAILVLGILGGIYISFLHFRRKARIRENEQAARIAINNFRDIEQMFKEQDKDGNGINDFWTGDVAGLFRYGLIDRSIALADVAPLNPLGPKPVPYCGYYFVALEGDDEFLKGDYSYKTETGGRYPMGKVHHLTRFGFCAFPEDPGVTGRRVYIVNQNFTVFFSNDIKPPTSWPDVSTLMTHWSKE